MHLKHFCKRGLIPVICRLRDKILPQCAFCGIELRCYSEYLHTEQAEILLETQRFDIILMLALQRGQYIGNQYVRSLLCLCLRHSEGEVLINVI